MQYHCKKKKSVSQAKTSIFNQQTLKPYMPRILKQLYKLLKI